MYRLHRGHGHNEGVKRTQSLRNVPTRKREAFIDLQEVGGANQPKPEYVYLLTNALRILNNPSSTLTPSHIQ